MRDFDLPARADYQEARLALLAGKPDAKAQLEKLAKDYPKEADLVREANLRLELAALPPASAAPAPAPAAPEKPAPEKNAPPAKQQKPAAKKK